MTISPANLPRPVKADVTRKIQANLVELNQNGKADAVLVVFMSECDAMATSLETHVTGKQEASVAHTASRARIETAKTRVCLKYRQIQGFLCIAATYTMGENAGTVQAIYVQACPMGGAFVDGSIADINANGRTTLNSLRSTAYEATLQSIDFPMVLLDQLEMALSESESAAADAIDARQGTAEHVDYGRHTEAEWPNLMQRLSSYLKSRVMPKDIKTRLENEAIMQPLTDELKKARAAAASRATRKAKKEAAEAAQAAAVAAPAPSVRLVKPAIPATMPPAANG